ncbi:MAG TPA: hypothetical protein VF746_14905 [Longimicrobium sp.]|jgi:hypothetical protein
MLNSHPNASAPARPLSAGRIRELLAALEAFGGDHLAFLTTGRGLQLLARVPMAANSPRFRQHPRAHVFGAEPGAVVEDFERLTWLWKLTDDCWSGGGGQVCARARIDQELAALRDPGALGGWGVFQNALAAQARQLESISDAELAAIEELAGELRAALDPGRSPALQELQQQIREISEQDHDAIRPEDPEAREWLAANGHDAPLAGNRFDEKAEALEFVEELYAAGAVRVVVASECIRDELEHGGPYADGLRVQLPAEPRRRESVLAVVNREVEEEGFDPYADTGQEAVFLWWD